MTEEQRSQAAFSAKTRRAAGLLAAAGVGSALTARCGDARASPPWLRPKSLAAGPLSILKQALRRFLACLVRCNDRDNVNVDFYLGCAKFNGFSERDTYRVSEHLWMKD